MVMRSQTLYFHPGGHPQNNKPLEPSVFLPSYPPLWCYSPLPQSPTTQLLWTFPLPPRMPAPWKTALNFHLLLEIWFSWKCHLPCSPLKLLLHLSFGIGIIYKLLSPILIQPVSSRMFPFHCHMWNPGQFHSSWNILSLWHSFSFSPHFTSCHHYYMNTHCVYMYNHSKIIHA